MIKRCIKIALLTLLVVTTVAMLHELNEDTLKNAETARLKQEQQLNNAYNEGYIKGSESMYSLLNNLSDQKKSKK